MSGWETTSTSITNSSDKTITLSCPSAGKKVLSGGYEISAASGSDVAKVAAVENYPSSSTEWRVKGIETSNIAGNWTLTVHVICATA